MTSFILNPHTHTFTRAHVHTYIANKHAGVVRVSFPSHSDKSCRSHARLNGFDIHHVERRARKTGREEQEESGESGGRTRRVKPLLFNARMSGVRAASEFLHLTRTRFFSPRSGQRGLGLWRMSTITPAALPGRNWLVTFNTGDLKKKTKKHFFVSRYILLTLLSLTLAVFISDVAFCCDL